MNLGSDNEYIGYARYRRRNDSPDVTYLSLCDADEAGAFKIYRRALPATGAGAANEGTPEEGK